MRETVWYDENAEARWSKLNDIACVREMPFGVLVVKSGEGRRFRDETPLPPSKKISVLDSTETISNYMKLIMQSSAILTRALR
jgi:hypothetical protein